MRHVRSILYAVVLAGAIWVFCGAGLGHSSTGTSVRDYTHLLLVLLAGAAYAILIFARISPAGPLAAGVIFLVASVWALASPSSYAHLWPSGVTWADLGLPGRGTAAILAVPMIATALSARRWETYEPPELPVFGRLGRTPGVARPTGPPAAGLDTAVLRLSDPDSTVMVIDMDQTQVVRAPEPPAPEPAALIPDLVPERMPEPVTADSPRPADLARPGDETMMIPPPRGDETMMIPPPRGDETMVIPNPEAVAAAADATQVIPRDLGGDRQVIKPPGKAPDPAEADRTQVIKPSGKAPDPAGADRTQVVKMPEPAEADQTQIIRSPEISGPRRQHDDDEAG